jgi:gluconolactonase
VSPLVPLSEFDLLADGLDHPEGVTWGPDGFVYAGGEAGQIYRVRAPVPGQPYNYSKL